MFSANDIIEMQYSCGGCFSGYNKIEIKANEDNASIMSFPSIRNKKNGITESGYILPIKEWKKYSNKINKITKKWAAKYVNNNIMDGYQWSLSFLFRNGEKKDYYGSNSFPDNWNDFKKILTKIEQRL